MPQVYSKVGWHPVDIEAGQPAIVNCNGRLAPQLAARFYSANTGCTVWNFALCSCHRETVLSNIRRVPGDGPLPIWTEGVAMAKQKPAKSLRSTDELISRAQKATNEGRHAVAKFHRMRDDLAEQKNNFDRACSRWGALVQSLEFGDKT
jgi:hypothetical protein